MEAEEQMQKGDNPDQRIIGEVGKGGPTIVFIAGLHGNETSGVTAIKQCMNQLENQFASRKAKLKGKVYAVAGNLAALQKKVRFVEEDLNRIWMLNRVDRVQKSVQPASVEEHELNELLTCFQKIIQESSGPIFFVDLHTTSSRTVPHIITNDKLETRKVSFKYPLPVILGIDSFVDGTMLSFLDEMGHRAIGFEGGQHDQPHTMENIIAFFWLTLVTTGIVKKRQVVDYKKYVRRLLVASQGHRQVYEVYQRYHVEPDEDFEMVPGYNNFHPVVKGQYLADSRSNAVLARERGFIFLPRYENQGNSGFFLLKKLSPSWLGWSLFLRLIRFEKILEVLPGVRKEKELEGAYFVNQKVARFFAAELFHLLGYRRVLRRNGEIILAKRSIDGPS